jgi:hypothetical protein
MREGATAGICGSDSNSSDRVTRETPSLDDLKFWR